MPLGPRGGEYHILWRRKIFRVFETQKARDFPCEMIPGILAHHGRFHVSFLCLLGGRK